MEGLSDILAMSIPLAPFMLVAFIVWTRHQQKLATMAARISAEKAAQYATQNRELEERVRVLERIVTDKSYDTAAQIEALRDVKRVEEEDERALRP